MPKILSLISLLLIITGVTLTFVAMNYRSPNHPFELRGDSNTFRPIWKQRHWFTPRGYRLHILGYILLAVGSSMFPIYHWFIE